MGKTIETFVIDDEPLARELIASYVRQTPFLHLKGIFGSAIEALDVLHSTGADLLFLDIQMPQLDGLELSKMLPEETKVVFTTAFEQYALEGFRVEAVDYLLKPISYPEFLRAATRAQRRIEESHAAQDSNTESSGKQTESTIESIFVKTEYRTVQIRLDEILYIEGMRDYVRIHTADGGETLTLMSLTAMEESLPADRFTRVHRSFIVNLSKITTLERNRIVFDKTYIPISDSYRDRFMELLSRRSRFL